LEKEQAAAEAGIACRCQKEYEPPQYTNPARQVKDIHKARGGLGPSTEFLFIVYEDSDGQICDNMQGKKRQRSAKGSYLPSHFLFHQEGIGAD
jgi:hypothetical protein